MTCRLWLDAVDVKSMWNVVSNTRIRHIITGYKCATAIWLNASNHSRNHMRGKRMFEHFVCVCVVGTLPLHSPIRFAFARHLLHRNLFSQRDFDYYRPRERFMFRICHIRAIAHRIWIIPGVEVNFSHKLTQTPNTFCHHQNVSD